ncbi:transcription factor SOX-13-like isoform X3 [Sebastes umbrosus]|uniref:transcription factor SOX-13-like isoform X3 n=1 Tax=Sebastes umbrosus TaxID=72105 RepID=UPI0018A088A8|nr:transcription factor SOX-13-like isoform X3 [Sebastes umbrosus]
MDMYSKKRKGEPGPPIRNTDQEPAETPAHTSASQVFHTGDTGRIQPLDGTGNGSKTSENYMNSVGASSAFEDGKLPPVSTMFNKLQLYQSVLVMELSGCDAAGGGVTSKTVPSGSCPAAAAASSGSQVSVVKLLPSVDQITERLNATQTSAAGEPLNPGLVHFTTLPRPRDLKQLQFGQGKNGYIKRPPNSFIVWSHIHRRKICPGANMMDSSSVLGREWSKLSEEQKRPYYEAAYKLKWIHRQQFPDYEFRPQKKKRIECLPSGQGAGQDPGISFSQAVPPDQSKLQGPNMYPCSAMMPYTVDYYPYPHFCQCHQMGPPLKAFLQITQCQQLHGGREELPRHQQRDETASVILEQPDIVTSRQLSANNKVQCRRQDDVDVVGLI